MVVAHKDGELAEVGGLRCHLPPVGYGMREERQKDGRHLYKLEPTETIKRHASTKLQYWEAEPLPEWYVQRREQEEMMQENMPTYKDDQLEAYRKREWDRRHRGVWFWNRGRPVYLTGMHYFYLNWWKIDSNPPSYRECDRLFFYFLQYCIEDENCLGMLSVAKRRSGKTMRSGVFTYEYVSRIENAHGGIQSKTDSDAVEVFGKAIVTPWADLPHFFRPIYDTIGGDRPSKVMRFFSPSRKGANAKQGKEDGELRSWIDTESRNALAYDGKALHRYVSDECGKLKDVDINKRHDVVRFCSTVNGRFIGKHLYTTTVEEIEDGGGKFKKLWDGSDHTIKKNNERTKTGLYRYFEPSYTIGDVDIYGFTNETENIKYHTKEREAYKDDREAYFGIIRRNAFTIEEAFKFSNKTGQYDTEQLYDRIEALELYSGTLEKGNFVWENSEPDSKVIWERSNNGRWTVCWKMPETDGSGFESNKVLKRGNQFIPMGKNDFVLGCDPFSHSETQDSRKSLGAAFVKRRFDPTREDDPMNDAFVCMYHSRPATVTIFHEDMLKMCVYYGCQMLLENNKNAALEYFKLRGYEAFLMKLAGYNEYGIPGNNSTAERIVDLTEEYINHFLKKIFFRQLLRQWIDFDFNNRTPSDLAMAAGYTLIADHKRTYKTLNTTSTPIESIFTMHKIA